ncbi:MAG: energy-coupling factor transporter ATPase [Negativicoccus succinicivorans]|uniref:Cobalt import ATP-binding protein CbiO 2 n=1 Tax=Negativicoccus succinicivorans DORA_17_25 TaxID=1403945 RepID=W1U405_9FIRM|nr:energy-coupling factor transporter ATPase [Negativicoccus succinicivorans]ETI86328.1 MAG: Cobalt import ATP-binding protein CbiO 2 [Negativicoccus succinicivorans DORA_17_25]MBS5917643.1 energy-coupling factor transporter ATPase [Negativicoccus succinicivorans]MDU2929163.1 energy-coupling factor transporter ATPase [Negativicoccus succinicivorans]MDU4203090.1 energy-coupling factor transporter ATPase [Negativicoccus succinicivorans]MDU5288444.1 energy-coupling factor transporter ATPase [Nega
MEQPLMFDIHHMAHAYVDEEGNTGYAIRDVSVQIKRGEFVAVIGTNGSGKSTFAKHLNALLLPTEGDVLVDGISVRDEARVWDIRSRVGMVFQNPDNQIVAAVVEEDVAFGPENLGVPREQLQERVDAALAAVDMTAYRKHAPHMLSGGQKQRVAIAGVLAMQPECIVLDEPTAMLDPRGREEVMHTVQALHDKRGMTVVYITHFMEEAAQADRILVMIKGELVMDGTPREVFADVDRLKELGLDVPVASEVAHDLRAAGIPLREDIITDEELGEALCQYNSKG